MQNEILIRRTRVRTIALSLVGYPAIAVAIFAAFKYGFASKVIAAAMLAPTIIFGAWAKKFFSEYIARGRSLDLADGLLSATGVAFAFSGLIILCLL